MHNKPKGLKDLTRRVWGKKLTLALVTHMLGGLGIGILIGSKGADQHVLSMAYALVGFSVLAHLHALRHMRLGKKTLTTKGEQNP
jgi:hypothetical protein